MKRVVTSALALFFLALTIISGMAWVNNLFVVRLWYLDLAKGDIAAAKGGAASLVFKVYQGPIASLNWSAVDLSTISTFIPFFGFLLVTLALARLSFGQRDFSEEFPFFRSYDRINVSLGLIGTVWGIIIIGYYPIETVSMSALMLCLHTALFSTLIAVVWVFIMVMLIIKPALSWWAAVVIGETDKTLGEDLVTVLDRLRSAAADTKDALGANQSKLGDFNRSLGDSEEKMKALAASIDAFRDSLGKELYGFLEQSFAKIGETLAALCRETDALRAEENARDQLIDKISAALDKTLGAQDALTKRLAELEARNDRTSAELAEVRALKDAVENRLERVKEVLK